MAKQTNDIEGLLRKYHSGHISKEELISLKAAINHSDDEWMKGMLLQHWENYEEDLPLPKEKKQAIYHKLKQRIHRPLTVRMRTYWAQIAAGLLFLLSVGMSVMFYTQRQELQELTSRNVVIRSGESPTSVTLPDGTKVQLNTRSSLAYQQDFGHNDRRVSLSGEGYFDVKRDESKQFVVQTEFIDITVLGTSFNVYAYEDQDFLEMALVKGSVCVNTARPPHQTLYACPNEKITYNKHTGELTLQPTSNQMETAWMKEALTFRHTPLREVFLTLERKFGISIQSSDTLLANDAYTGSFKQPTLEKILDVLKQHYGFSYTRNKDTISIDMK